MPWPVYPEIWVLLHGVFLVVSVIGLSNAIRGILSGIDYPMAS